MKNKKRNTNFIILCSAVYFISYITRNSFNAVITELSSTSNTTLDELGFVGTCAFLTYGIGQIICGALGDKFSPRILIFTGAIITAVCNILMPFAFESNILMAVIWGANGFAQSIFWPPLVRLLAERLSSQDYNRAVVAVTTASSIGNILLYLTAPVCIAISGWRPVFFIAAAMAVGVSAVWLIGTRSKNEACEINDTSAKNTIINKNTCQKHSVGRIIISSGIIMILICIVLQGMLRDGLATWMPSLIANTYGFSNAISVLAAVILPVFAIIGIKTSERIQKRLNNELKCSALMFVAGFIASAVMLVIYSSSAAASIALMSLITAFMHGVNLMLISRVPAYFARFGKISTVSGILNAFTYIGSAASSYGFAWLSEQYGWSFTVGSWVVITVLGAVLSIVTAKRWKRFIEE